MAGSASGHSSPKDGAREPTRAKEYKEFDPATFASKLVYSDAVKAPGLSKDDATRLGIGWHPQRKAMYFPQKDDTASPGSSPVGTESS